MASQYHTRPVRYNASSIPPTCKVTVASIHLASLIPCLRIDLLPSEWVSFSVWLVGGGGGLTTQYLSCRPWRRPRVVERFAGGWASSPHSQRAQLVWARRVFPGHLLNSNEQHVPQRMHSMPARSARKRRVSAAGAEK